MARKRSALRSRFDFDRQDKHEMECTYFKSFRYFERDIQSADVVRAESPDFCVKVGDRVIGVEITKMYKGLPDIESTQDRILDHACWEAERMGPPPAHVTLFFNLRRPINDWRSRRRIGDAVARVVASNMPPDGESIDLERRPEQPTEVDLILVNRRYCHAPGRWEWLAAGAVEKDVVDVIGERITAKAKKFSTYRDACDECWLLLVADSFRNSGKLEFGERCLSHVFTSPFTRTYILDFGRGQPYRLRTQA